MLMDALTVVGLVAALALALSFEFVNGFHDTANAVATVIYTRTLKPTVAVVYSGIWNLIGVLLSSGAVAFGIVALLPVELVIHVGSAAGFAMVFAMLVSAIIWNIGTWSLGLPASSSHTLIGSIVGVGLANSMLQPGHVFGDGVNWGKVQDTALALVVSPVIGFVCAGLLLVALRALVKYKKLFDAPTGEEPPPWPIRALLVLTCTGVSFAHGSNDGQKGMGLIMLILIGVLPGVYAINPNVTGAAFASIGTASARVSTIIANQAHAPAAENAPAPKPQPTLKPGSKIQQALAKKNADSSGDEQILSDYIKSGAALNARVLPALADKNAAVTKAIAGKTSLDGVSDKDRTSLRTNVYLVAAALDKLTKANVISAKSDAAAIVSYRKQLDSLTKFIPNWVKVAVALALGLGTMIGWKRIVVTVGERIGKTHLTYAQGASAELVAWATIEAADIYGLPVSTTHVLSSGIAGTMFANRSGLQGATLRNILLAWILTLPVCVLLGSVLFSAAIYLLTRFGAQ